MTQEGILFVHRQALTPESEPLPFRYPNPGPQDYPYYYCNVVPNGNMIFLNKFIYF